MKQNKKFLDELDSIQKMESSHKKFSSSRTTPLTDKKFIGKPFLHFQSSCTKTYGAKIGTKVATEVLVALYFHYKIGLVKVAQKKFGGTAVNLGLFGLADLIRDQSPDIV